MFAADKEMDKGRGLQGGVLMGGLVLIFVLCVSAGEVKLCVCVKVMGGSREASGVLQDSRY